jgi:two-component system chemotaxis response regulator CheY
MRVLIADDQRSFATVLADMVRYCGHQVVATVGSGFEAIQAYTVHKPDLVLMDHRMPKLNGVTASRHIIAKNPEARVVLLSAWSPLDGADESGAICYLPKPVEMARLNAVLLTISHSLPPSEADLPPPDPAAFSVDSMPYVPIPQEIISPVETFPITSFPLEDPQNDVDQTAAPEVVEPSVVDQEAKPRKTRKVRARNKSNSRPR